MVIPWVTQQFTHRAISASARRSLNIYPEVLGDQGKTTVVWVGTPGTAMYCDLSSYGSSIRGMYYASDALYVAVGASIVKVSNDPITGLGIASLMGTIGAGTTRVSMIDDGTNVVGTDGSNMFRVVIATNSFSLITAPSPVPTQLVYLGARGVGISGSEQFVWTEVQDVTTWDAGFATAETYSDPIIAVSAKGGELWLFGPRSYEVWRVDSDPDLPFALVGGSAGDIGCGAASSVAQIGDSVFWLGSSTSGAGQVFRSNGYQAQRISNHAIEYALSQIDQTDGVGWCYQQEGHVFYVLTFRNSGLTLVYDSTTDAWHERSRFVNGSDEAWEPIYGAFFGGKVVCGSALGGRLLSLDLGRYMEHDGGYIVRVMQGPAIWQDLKQLFISEFQIDLEAGVGLQNGQGSDPVAMLQYSDDGGHTWSNELQASMGKIGEYAHRLRWRRLGKARDRVFRVSISDPVKCVIIGGAITAEAADR